MQSWLVKALHDLATARKAASPPDPYLDTAIYHCQQAGEKTVKGFLAFHDQPPVDLVGLSSMAKAPLSTAAAPARRPATEPPVDDVALVPGMETLDPELCDLSLDIGDQRFDLPILAAAMDGVVDPAFAVACHRLVVSALLAFTYTCMEK